MAEHGLFCHCAVCVPCVHHPGQDCDCYCRFTFGCHYGNCEHWVGPLSRAEREVVGWYDEWGDVREEEGVGDGSHGIG